MAIYDAGSVSAKIILDSTKFDEGIDEIKTKLADLKDDFKNVSIESLAKQLEQTKKQMNGFDKELKDVKKQLDSVKKSNESFGTTLDANVKKIKTETDALKTEQKALDTEVKKKKEATKANEQYSKSVQNAEKSSKKYNEVLSRFGKDFYNLTNQAWLDSGKRGIVDLAPIYNQLKDQYKGIVKNKKTFDKLLADSLMGTNSQLFPTRDSEKFVNVMGKNWGSIDTSNLKKFSMAWKETASSVKQSESEVESVAQKSAAAVESSSNKTIQAKKKEADAIKIYTETEIKLLQNLNRGLKYYKKEGTNLVPIDFYKNLGGHKIEGFRNYSSMRKSAYRNGTIGWKEYAESGYDDFTKAFQTRMKSLLKDINVFTSDVLDDEFKKVRDKTTGKLVEYLDISKLTPNVIENNEKWLQKAQRQLWGLNHYKEKMEKYLDSWRNHKYDRQELKGYMDWNSKYNYDEYGKEGNPFIKDYLKNTREGQALVEKYKQAQRDLDDAYYHPNRIRDASKALDTFNRGLKTTAVNLEKLKTEGFLKDFAINDTGIQRTSQEIDKLISKFAQFNEKTKMLPTRAILQGIGEVGIGFKRTAEEVEKAISKFADTGKSLSVAEEFSMTLRALSNYMKEVCGEYNRFGAESDKIIANLEKQAIANENNGKSFKTSQQNLQYLTTGYNKFNETIVRTTEVLKTFNFTLLEGVEKESIFYQRTVQLASAMQRMNSQGTKNWAGRGQFGYSQYLQQSQNINKNLSKDFQTTYTKMDKALQNLGTGLQRTQKITDSTTSSLRKLTQQINAATNPTNTLARGMQYMDKNALRARYGVESFGKGVKVVGDYTRISEKDLKNMTNSTKLTANEARNAGRGLTSFNNGIQQTAHSGRILSNTLYQIRGALLSLKMIFTAMGGMALWGFAMDMVEGVKETYNAKNEMESLLLRNPKMNAGGIQYFNEQLDQTSKEFKKINKYSIGETVASIGLEFDLSAKEMGDALDVVTMIQSEYIRAGRTEDEAALAVKDILQGEFQRLSRETGVGKEELIAYGWSGDKSDVKGLLKALRKAATDRHWDAFAAKATSLNDVLTITKSRFSEFGADLLDKVSPMIVGAFNTILGVVEGVKKGFEGLSTFWQKFLAIGLPIGGIATLVTGIAMISKNMGLVDIATIGWGKSLLTAAFNLNKTEVASYGFRKALAAVITGTNASELANVSSTKALLGRLLGVNQNTLAEKGFLTAMVQSKAVTKGHNATLAKLAANNMGAAQKVAYLTTNISLETAKSEGLAKSLARVATSTKLWGMAIKGLLAIGILSWLASIYMWTDKIKSKVDAWHNIYDNGNDMIAEAEKTVEGYTNKLAELTEGTDEYNRTNSKLQLAKYDLADLKMAKQATDEFKEQNAEKTKGIKLEHQRRVAESYRIAGKDPRAANEMAAGYYQQVLEGQDAINHSYDVYNDRLYKSSQHVNEHVEQLKAAGISEEQLLNYITDYNAEAEQTAELWKKFNQGDIASGFYAILSELKLWWTDITYNEDVILFFDNLKKTWNDMQPTIKMLSDNLHALFDFLIDVGNQLMSSEFGRLLSGDTLLGLGGLFIFSKISKKLFGSGIIDFLKKCKDHLPDVIDKFKKLGDVFKKTGEDIDDSGMGDIILDKKDKKKDKKKKKKTDTDDDLPDVTTGGGDKAVSLGEQLKSDAGKYLRAGFAIAAGMALITEAVYLLKAPMWALSEVGKDFKAQEPQIRQGIEGLQTIAPVMAVFLPPVVALMVIMGKFSKTITPETMADAFLKSVIGIAMAMGLVAEAIVMFIAPMTTLSVVGQQFTGMEQDIKNGVKGIEATTKALEALVPWIPVFIAGIALTAVAFATEIGWVAIPIVAAGIAAGILAVSEAIALMVVPLGRLEEVGKEYGKLENVDDGVKAMEATSKALEAVATAAGAVTATVFDDLATRLATWGKSVGEVAQELAEEDGFINDLVKFVKAFNDLPEIPTPEPGKIDALVKSADGVKTIAEGLDTIKKSIEELGLGTEAKSYEKYNQAVGNDTQNVMQDISLLEQQFTEMEEVIGKVNDFMKNVNEMEITPPKFEVLSAITQSAQFISTVKTAVDNVKTVITGMGDIGAMVNNQQNGVISGGLQSWLMGTGQADNSSGGSSLKAGLDEIYRALVDIIQFSGSVSKLTGASTEAGDSDSIAGIANMVTAVAQVINDLSTTLQNAVPQIKSDGTNIGKAVKDGLSEGMTGLETSVKDKVSQAIEDAKPTAETYGKGLGGKVKDGFKTGIDTMSTAMNSEIDEINKALTDRKQEVYDNSKAMGEAAAKGFKDGQDQHSPGIMARSMFQEIDYISEALINAKSTLSDLTYNLGESISGNFDVTGMFNSLASAMNGMSFDDIIMPSFDYTENAEAINQFTSDVNQVSLASATTSTVTQQQFGLMNTAVGNDFSSMGLSITTTFDNIKNNTTSSYNQIANTTKTQLANMQSQTTKNIQAIRTSWKGMQDALIASAENIRSQTGAKIQSLQSNMASFWRKVQNPALLLGAGSPDEVKHTIKRGSAPRIKSPSTNTGTSPRRYAGGLGSLRKPKTGEGQTGISSGFRPKQSSMFLLDYLAEYLETIRNNGMAFAGGWNFNWSKDIQNALLQWHTHFGEIYDDVLSVGKFENDDFPVRGNATIAKRYIYDAISRTSYGFYFNSKCGDDPLAAWNSGSFNCWDGANVIIALANAFGFGGGYKGSGTWSGIGHVWAVVPGLGIMDATAIQRGYGFTSPKVSGYAGGTIKRTSAYKPSNEKGSGESKVINVNVDLSNSRIYGIDDLDNHIKDTTKKVMREEFNDPYSVPL